MRETGEMQKGTRTFSLCVNARCMTVLFLHTCSYSKCVRATIAGMGLLLFGIVLVEVPGLFSDWWLRCLALYLCGMPGLPTILAGFVLLLGVMRDLFLMVEIPPKGRSL